MNRARDPHPQVDLAHEPDFRLGALEGHPSACRVRVGGREERIEPRVMEVLVVLVRHAGHTVTRDQLIETCWGGRVVSDDAVARAVAQIRALARGVHPPPFVLETVPKVGFRLTVPDVAASDPPAPAKSPAEREPRLGRRRRAALAVTLAIGVLASLGIWRFSGDLGRFVAGQNGRVDVIRFEARSPDPEAQKVAAETGEAIVQILSNNGVRTAAWARPRDAGAGRAELRVVGTVDRKGDDVTIRPQIIERKTGLVLWSQRFQRPISGPIRPAEEAAAVVGSIVRCALEDRERSRAGLSGEALSLEMNACAVLVKVSLEDIDWQQGLRITRRLTDIAPQFAAGHATHAIMAAMVGRQAEPGAEQKAELLAEAKAEADRARRLDGRAANAWLARAVLARERSDFLETERLSQEAVKWAPDSPLTQSSYAGFLREVGRIDAALDVLSSVNAARDARLGPTVDARAAILLAASGDVDGALAEIGEFEAYRQADYQELRWLIAFWRGDPTATLSALAAARRNGAAPPIEACYAQYLERLVAAAGHPIQGLPQACAAFPMDWRIRMLAREGDVDGAYDIWTSSPPSERRSPLILYYPEMASFRRDPRFWPLLARIGLADYWARSGRWPDFCAEPGLPYDCRTMAQATSGR
jgi:DNA-binding winged helix-turn-helix (wHTH) protein/tetratricopeptide (TPR) repeat protein/TolB-like protein